MYLDLTYDTIGYSQATDTGLGVLDLASPATSGEYAMYRGDHGAVALDAVDALQLHAIIALRSVASIFVEVGFCDSDRTDYARFLFDTSVDPTAWRFETRDNTTQDAVTLPADLVPVADEFQDLYVVLNESFAAAWIGANGPYDLTSNLPLASVTPYVLIGTRTAATKTLRIDRVALIGTDGAVRAPADLGY